MIVSTKGRYALRVMIDLAEHQAEKYVPLKEVAARQEISEKYLENILKVLVQNGFLEGLRGKGGGYRLTRSPDQYTVEEILMLTEGSLAPVTCLTPGASPCARLANCRTYEMWKGLNDLISNYFSHITLADLALPDQAGNDYVILLVPAPASYGAPHIAVRLFCTVPREMCGNSWQVSRLMDVRRCGILPLASHIFW